MVRLFIELYIVEVFSLVSVELSACCVRKSQLKLVGVLEAKVIDQGRLSKRGERELKRI